MFESGYRFFLVTEVDRNKYLSFLNEKDSFLFKEDNSLMLIHMDGFPTVDKEKVKQKIKDFLNDETKKALYINEEMLDRIVSKGKEVSFFAVFLKRNKKILFFSQNTESSCAIFNAIRVKKLKLKEKNLWDIHGVNSLVYSVNDILGSVVDKLSEKRLGHKY